jgi:hypothetical protein
VAWGAPRVRSLPVQRWLAVDESPKCDYASARFLRKANARSLSGLLVRTTAVLDRPLPNSAAQVPNSGAHAAPPPRRGPLRPGDNSSSAVVGPRRVGEVVEAPTAGLRRPIPDGGSDPSRDVVGQWQWRPAHLRRPRNRTPRSARGMRRGLRPRVRGTGRARARGSWS